MADSTPSSVFDRFEIKNVTYKTVGDTPIEASIMIPKALLKSQTGKPTPVAIRWHGGFLVTGHRLLADWYPKFILDLCLERNAIAITVDYRLVPEASGAEILEDVKDFYSWLATPGNLARQLPAGIEADLDNLLVTGESAGGYLSFMSATLGLPAIKAVVMHYPMLDLRADHYTKAYEKHIFDPPVPQIPAQVLSKHIAGLTGHEVVASDLPVARIPLAMSMVQQGRTADFLGKERSLYPLEMLEDGTISKLPPLWILHGKQDTAVPAEGTYRFLDLLRDKVPGAKVHATFEDGEHGFDNHAPATEEAATLDTAWVKEGVRFVEEYWLIKCAGTLQN
ncbi:hypothetical protein LTR56_021354 [Elasticomyces elasticus]|nr:hypothetical protein LTR56_021354 [Elasticomyces elasticus]KAK3631695.1 hypothetical protein LTR22_020985 [Elasticomyces elasticus]KAK4909546.1 hypothetical protein LTR49_021663 [Elasticomyces elasticus]KAK5754319.1 hypothetical protein LTS12_015610 [Elasticomyces elasticus]